MQYKFEKLEVWQLAIQLIKMVYELTNKLPKIEESNLKVQMIKAATSVALNIAEGSTSQSNAEQNRFLGFSLRSLVEVVACTRVIEQLYVEVKPFLSQVDEHCELLFKKLQAFRKALNKN